MSVFFKNFGPYSKLRTANWPVAWRKQTQPYNKHCYITGDFNFHLLKHESHSVTAQFIESLFAFGFLPMITKPTRITAHSATLIDNIFTNNTTVSSKSGLIISDISDHLPIFSIVFVDYLRKDSNIFTIRDTSEIRVKLHSCNRWGTQNNKKRFLRTERPPKLTTFQFLLSKKHSISFQIRYYQLLTYLCHQEFFQIDWNYLKLFLSLYLITLA